MEWQLIETAPRDGTWIIAYEPRWPRPFLMAWKVSKHTHYEEVDGGLFRKLDTEYGVWSVMMEHSPYGGGGGGGPFNPTHWMPIPNPPIDH